MTIKLYGIPNCDTVKKARKSLEKDGIDYQFIDFKKGAPKQSDVLRWKKAIGEWPVNKKGRTYRLIKEEFEAASEEGKMAILLENTSALKRPILEKGPKVLCLGFDPEIYQKL